MKSISEDEMILEFLLAEALSSRFEGYVYAAIPNPKLLYEANLQDVEENKLRKEALNYRGYADREFLFAGLQQEIEWFKNKLSKSKLLDIKYAQYPTWLTLSENTRRPDIAAKNIKPGMIINNEPLSHIFEIEKKIKNNENIYRLICIRQKGSEKIVVLEGHSRLTAYAIAYPNIPNNIEIILGEAEDLSSYAFY